MFLTARLQHDAPASLVYLRTTKVLFFFISGVFTPRSFERKGWTKFLEDRMLRLALPCVDEAARHAEALFAAHDMSPARD